MARHCKSLSNCSVIVLFGHGLAICANFVVCERGCGSGDLIRACHFFGGGWDSSANRVQIYDGCCWSFLSVAQIVQTMTFVETGGVSAILSAILGVGNSWGRQFSKRIAESAILQCLLPVLELPTVLPTRIAEVLPTELPTPRIADRIADAPCVAVVWGQGHNLRMF